MTSRILTLDLERVPAWTKPLPFWSPRDLQKKYITADDVQEWGRTICLAYSYLDEREIHFIAEWQDGGRQAYLERARALFDECDVLGGHNSKDFDFKHLQGDFIMAGLTPAPEPRHIDTLKLARSNANWEMNHLAVLTSRLGIPSKNDKYRISVAMAAVGGDAKAQKRIERYNKGDVRASKGLIKKLLPVSNVNLGAFEDDPTRPVCPKCKSRKVQRRGFTTTQAGRYPRFQCQSCGGWSRGKKLLGPTTELRPA